MVLGLTAAGASATAVGSWLWSYNRENFKYDREMRQKNEFKLLEFRKIQAELWRDDIRDIIGLTEKKMDAYLIISILQLDACLGLFTEGRLEPGTPPWLLSFYMLTLAGSFMYLLMSAWFAMHASVVAQCSSVRLLTQFVRLPIPTWKQLEDMRTYGQEYESLHGAHWFRVPYTRSLAPTGVRRGQNIPAGQEGSDTRLSSLSKKGNSKNKIQRSSMCSNVSKASEETCSDNVPPSGAHPDPWCQELHGDERQLYELSKEGVELRRHVRLAKDAAKQYQCFDAFARVAMTFGTNQLLLAIAFYCLGYVSVQDGAPFVAMGAVAVMASIACIMIQMDFTMTRCEGITLQGLIVVGLAAATIATLHIPDAVIYLLPIVYVSNGLWLWKALATCGITETESGALLPMKFRAMLFLDVFGWLTRGQDGGLSNKNAMFDDDTSTDDADSEPKNPEKWNSVSFAADIFSKPQRLPPEWSHAEPSGQIEPPEGAFDPTTYAVPDGGENAPSEGDSLAGFAQKQPGRTAAQVFRSATWLLIFLWFAGAVPDSLLFDSMKPALVADVFLEEASSDDTLGHGAMHAVVGQDSSGLPELMPVVDNPEKLRVLPGTPELVQVDWPSHISFVPRAMTSNPRGQYMLISDDFNTYSAEMVEPGAQSRNLTASNLRGVSDFLSRADAGSNVASLSFSLNAACPSFEGKSLQDIALLCSDSSSTSCRVLALTNQGRLLTQCEIDATNPPGIRGNDAGDWTISQDWLRRDQDETVQSLALNDACVKARRVNSSNAPSLDPRATGCVVVGTSSGRLVELRQALENDDQLVPVRVMHQRAHPSSRGALTFIGGKYLVALWTKYGSISAFNAKKGSVVKEWRLPEHAKWLMLSKGAGSIFFLGVRADGDVEIYRMPRPPELSPTPAENTDLLE